MDSEKYIGLDVHQATIVVAVMDSTDKETVRRPGGKLNPGALAMLRFDVLCMQKQE